MPATIITVDHGMLNDPGGFIPLGLARDCAIANPNIRSVHLEHLNHYTVLHQHGATAVAEIITGYGSA